jgi:hypothetical protein
VEVYIFISLSTIPIKYVRGTEFKLNASSGPASSWGGILVKVQHCIKGTVTSHKTVHSIEVCHEYFLPMSVKSLYMVITFAPYQVLIQCIWYELISNIINYNNKHEM